MLRAFISVHNPNWIPSHSKDINHPSCPTFPSSYYIFSSQFHRSQFFFSSASKKIVNPKQIIVDPKPFNQIALFKGYIDKTNFIDRIAGQRSKTNTFIYFPEGWGKSTVLSMLQSYFKLTLDSEGRRLTPSSKGLTDLTKAFEKAKQEGNKKEVKRLFELMTEKKIGLSMKKKCKTVFDGKSINQLQSSEWLLENYFGEHPVIKIKLRSFQNCKSIESVKETIKLSLSQTYADHPYLDRMVASSTTLQQKFRRIKNYRELSKKSKKSLMQSMMFRDKDIKDSIHFLAGLLVKHMGEKPLILIDNFENFALEIFDKPFASQAYDLICNMFVHFIKFHSEHNFKVIAMGVIPIDFESQLWSISDCINLSNAQSADYFGYTREEVKKLLTLVYPTDDTKVEQSLNKLSRLVGGYNVAGKEIFNLKRTNEQIRQILENLECIAEVEEDCSEDKQKMPFLEEEQKSESQISIKIRANGKIIYITQQNSDVEIREMMEKITQLLFDDEKNN